MRGCHLFLIIGGETALNEILPEDDFLLYFSIWLVVPQVICGICFSTHLADCT